MTRSPTAPGFCAGVCSPRPGSVETVGSLDSTIMGEGEKERERKGEGGNDGLRETAQLKGWFGTALDSRMLLRIEPELWTSHNLLPPHLELQIKQIF